MAKFEIFQSPLNRQFYWRLRAGNNEIVAQSEGYARKESASHTVNMIRTHAHGAVIADLT